MISTDLRNLASSMKAHADCDQLAPGFVKVLLARLCEIADQAAALEGMTVPPHLRGGFFAGEEPDTGNVVSIRAHVRSKPKLVKSNNGGDAA